MFRIFVKWCVKIFTLIVFRVKTYGQENIEEGKPYIMCANHISNWDALTIYTATKREMFVMAKEEMFVNTTDSKIKTVIDSWYALNMTGYTNMLEDTVWCNDRTITSGPLYSKDANSTGASYFGAYLRNVSSIGPSLTCPEKLDSFTVSSSKGNGSLIYPVGLLTADEYTLAGSGNKGYSTTSYLHTGQYQWSLSPFIFRSNGAVEFALTSSGTLNNLNVNSTRGVRPSVSLKLGTLISGGDGSVSTPYIVN